jgi:hypothetical protein
VLSSLRVDRCAKDDMALRAHQPERAAVAWDDDRRLDVEEIAASWSRRPALIARRLTRTRQGCEWMIERWGALRAVAEAGVAWDEAQTKLALDLLGVPTELRNALAFEAAQPSAALAAREVELLERRLDRGLIDIEKTADIRAKIGHRITLGRDPSYIEH